MKLEEQTKEKNTKTIKKKETAQRDYFKWLEFEQYYLKKRNNNMRKCNKCRQNFDDENYVIGFKLIVLKRGTKLQDDHLTEGIVRIYVRNDKKRQNVILKTLLSRTSTD